MRIATHKTNQMFKAHFGAIPDLIARAPGRLGILGNHTDYNEGYVLSCGVQYETTVSLRKAEGNSCRVISPVVDAQMHSFALDVAHAGDLHWTAYIRGVIAALQRQGHVISAFDVFIDSTIPLAAGMSSSAALEMALVTGLDKLFGLDLSLLEKARIGQICEHQTLGIMTGLMDQLSSLAAKQSCLLISEFRHHTLHHCAMPEGYVFVVANTGIRHDLSKEYNVLRGHCADATEVLAGFESGVGTLRDVSSAMISRYRDNLDIDALGCAKHVVEENERVLHGQRLLARGQVEKFGQLMFDSHESSRLQFGNSCPELDGMVEIAKHSPHCVGARLSGGGFGGITVHLVKNDQAEIYMHTFSPNL